MSTDLVFWKGSSEGLSPAQVYQRLGEQHLDGIDAVDANQVEGAFAAGLTDGWSRVGSNAWVHGGDEHGNGPAMELEIGEQHVTASCHGLEGPQLNEIIDVMLELGYPLYDPQIDERFA